jgi:DNA-binding NtrC family response regulator
MENARGLPRAVRRLSLSVARGPDAGKLVEPPPGEGASVGSAEDNDVVLADPTVSRYHVELQPVTDGIAVRDLGSLNGTFCGGLRVRDAVVPPGSQLRLGGTTILVDAADAADARADHEEDGSIAGLVFASEPMRKVVRQVRALAGFAGAVLIQGETGTGKERIAHALHEGSPRRDKPFVIVDCASLPQNLVEAELFGHERGAFTGADRTRAGAFERAHGGTVFLDEIGELPLAMQPVLLGVLERKRLRRVGGDAEIPADVRVIAATNRDLRAEVNRGAFRADLYYRLAGARVVLPALRDRPEDIPVLVRHFLQELTGGDDASLSAETLASFAAQHWPGNVRELRSAVERALALEAAGLGPDLEGLEPPAAAPNAPATVERYRDARARALAAFERDYLARLIASCKGNASEAARKAQMDRPYLLSLLKKYGLR